VETGKKGVVTMSNKKLHNLISLLLQELQATGSPLVGAFNPGLTSDVISSKMFHLGLGNCELLICFYEVTNGIDDKFVEGKDFGEITLFSLAVCDSIETSIESYQYNVIEHSYWEKGLFPIFSSGLGDFYLLDLRQHQSTYGMIWLFSPTSIIRFGQACTIYDSLEALLRTIIECYRQRAYFFSMELTSEFSSGPYRQTNAELEIEIAKVFNPLSDHWQELPG
jgi:hypothetical protein